ncbi:MAG: hypothetical protein KGI33_10255 [Thaumarchaeota archaeon]|nr:hypothetical protein [Nitrososphaerota archaeon]
MARTRKIPRLTFTINPNPNGFLVVCNEIPYLFTDTNSVQEIDKVISAMISDYVENFPDDAEKRGIDKDIATLTVWKGSPNSVALE